MKEFVNLTMSVCAALSIGTGTMAQQVTIEVLAIEGDFIPGTTDVYTGVGTPSVNSRGDVAFEASHTPGYLQSCLMYYDAGLQQLMRLANEDDPAPGERGLFEEFGPQAPALCEDGTVGFIATLQYTTPAGVDSGVYRVHPDDGIPVEIVFESDPVSSDVSLGRFSTYLQYSGPQLPMNAQGEVAFWSYLTAPENYTYGVYRASEGSLAEIMRTGRVGPGIGGIVDDLTAPDLNDRGEVAFAVEGVGTSAFDAVYKGSGGGLTTIAKRNQVLFPEINLDGFRRPAINDRGEVACRAYMETPITYDWGLIIGTGGVATPVWVPGEPAPGGDFKDGVGTDPALNNRGQIAFEANVYPHQAGVFFWDGFQVHKIAREYDSAPRGGTFTGIFESIAINDDGQVMFIARIDDAGTTRTGLMLWDESDGLVEIIRDGDQLAGSTVASGRIYVSGCEYSRVVPFEQSSLGGDGVLAFEFGLDDGREGIAATTLIMPPSPNTDIRFYHALDTEVAEPTGNLNPRFSETFTDYVADLEEVYGVAADGVATIAIVYETSLPGVAQFHVQSWDGLNDDIGSLMEVDGTPGSELADGSWWISVNTQPIGEGKHAAVALYRAPEEYVRLSSLGDALLPYRGVSVTVTQGEVGAPDAMDMALAKISRPPVTLVHGIWGDPSTWDIAPGLEAAGFWVFLVDYESTNAASFDVNDDRVCAQIWSALRQYRQQTGCSAGQTIVAGHSMGGVLTRRVIGGVSGCAFRSFLNHGEGTVDRFVTIATPHHGGEPARLLVLPSGVPIPILSDIVELLEGCVDCGAVRDLHPESIATLTLPDTRSLDVPSHAITGSGGDDWIDVTDAFSDWIGTTSVVERIIHFLAELLVFYEDIIFGAQDHDLIVSLTSQRGGLAVNDTTDFGFAVLPFLGGTHVVLPDETRVLDELVWRFHLPLGDLSWASGFPPVPAPFSSYGSGVVPPAPYAGSGGMVVSIDGELNSVSGGSDVPVSAHAFGDFVPESVLFISSFGVQAADGLGGATLHIPVDAPSGLIDVVAFARNAADEVVLSEPVSLDVVVPAQLLATGLEPSVMALSIGSPTQSVSVLGYFDDGVIRQIDPALSAIAFTSDDPAIATVDPSGLVVAQSIGDTVIYVRSESEQLAVSVQVTETPALEPICEGDANGNDIVDVNDISYVLFRLGKTGSDGDANGDNTVDVNDISYVLFRLGNSCL